MNRTWRAGFIALALFLSQSAGVGLGGLQAQRPIQRDTLPSPEAVLARGFTAITSVHELADGRILLSDPRERALAAADFADGSVENIGRTGGGPGEFRVALPVHSLGGARAIMVDPMSRRWLYFEGAEIVETLTDSHAAVRSLGGNFPYGVDSLGHVLTTIAGRGDSVHLVLYSRMDGTNQTVGALYQPSSELPGLLQAYEKAFLAVDGWIAVLRIDPYRVDWRAPNGSWIRGRALPHQADPLDRADRDRLSQSARYRGINWPESWPASRTGAELLPTRDGHVLIRRSRPTRDQVVRYDVVNRSGELTVQLELPLNESILGFGVGTVYTVVRDEFDLQFIRRHRWERR